MSVLVSDGTGNCKTFVKTVVEEALVDVPGCERAVCEMQTQNALQEFCRQGWALVERGLGPYTVRANRVDVPLDPISNDIRVAYVFGAYYGERPMTPAKYRVRTLSAQVASNSTPYWYDSPRPGELRVWPLSSVDIPKCITVTAALVPLTINVNLPDHFFTHYKEGVKSGALHRLMASPSKPYTNALGSRLHYNLFTNAWRAARSSAVRGFSTEAPSGWHYPQGWANSGRVR